MFVPFNVDKDNYKTGDIVVNRVTINIIYGVFTIGHEFTVQGKDGYGYILKDNEHGIIVKKINHTKISIKIDFKKAKIIRDNRMDRIKIKLFISKNCSKKTPGYEDRSEYTSCIMKPSYNDECYCVLGCITYVDHNKIKENDFVSTYLRRMKLKKLKKISDKNI